MLRPRSMATVRHADGSASIEGDAVVIRFQGGAVSCPVDETDILLQGGVLQIYRNGQAWIKLDLGWPRRGLSEFLDEWQRAKSGEGSVTLTPLEATFIVRDEEGSAYAAFYGDMVIFVQADTSWLWGAKDTVYEIPIEEATAHLFGRMLRIHHRGIPWVELFDVEDLAVARDFLDELRRLRALALG